MNLPNLITSLRIVGSPFLVVLGLLQQPWALAILTALLVLTEWLDGFLARALHQESATGARLDTIADALFYSSMLIAVACLMPDRIAPEFLWMGAAIGSYLCSWGASWIKFRRLPSYHTWMAKAAWFFVVPGLVLLLWKGNPWLLRVAMLVVVATNLEAILITCKLRKPRVDVPSLWHLRQPSRR